MCEDGPTFECAWYICQLYIITSVDAIPLHIIVGMAVTGLQRLKESLSLNISRHVKKRGVGTEDWVLVKSVELARVFKDGIAHKLLTDIRRGIDISIVPLAQDDIIISHPQCWVCQKLEPSQASFLS